jgi:excinuclease ABC subunit B
MKRTISETDRRRSIQETYNREHGKKPEALRKSKEQIIAQSRAAGSSSSYDSAQMNMRPNLVAESKAVYTNRETLEREISRVRKEMEKAAKALDFIEAASQRDLLLTLESKRSEVRA